MLTASSLIFLHFVVNWHQENKKLNCLLAASVCNEPMDVQIKIRIMIILRQGQDFKELSLDCLVISKWTPKTVQKK